MPTDFASLIDRLAEASAETKALISECHGLLRDMRREKRELVDARASARREQNELRRLEDEHIAQITEFMVGFKTDIAEALRAQAGDYSDRAMHEYRKTLGIDRYMPEPPKPWQD